MARKWRARPEIWHRRGVIWLAILLLGGLGYVLAGNVQDRLREAEATAVRVTLNNLRSQLVIEQSTAMAKQQQGALAELEGANPFELVETTPAGYSGKCPATPPDQDRGSWCYSQDRGAVYYRPRFDAALPGTGDEEGRHGWRLELNRDGPGQPELQLNSLIKDEK